MAVQEFAKQCPDTYDGAQETGFVDAAKSTGRKHKRNEWQQHNLASLATTQNFLKNFKLVNWATTEDRNFPRISKILPMILVFLWILLNQWETLW